MKLSEFLAQLVNELHVTGSALSMYNAETDEFSIIPKNEFFIMPNRKEKEIDINEIKSAICDKEEMDSVTKPQPKWKASPSPYVGKNIAITGSVTKKVSVDFFKNLIRKLGANVKSSVGPTTDLLIVGELSEPSKKLVKAGELNTHCIGLNEFLTDIGYEDRRHKGDWGIDETTGRKILVYKNCSVIEDKDAEYVLSLISADGADVLQALGRASRPNQIEPDSEGYVNHARPSQRRAAEKAVGVPTCKADKPTAFGLNWFSSEQKVAPATAESKLQEVVDAMSDTEFQRYMKEFRIRADNMEKAIDNICKPKNKIEYTSNIRPDGSADIFKYQDGKLASAYHVPKALLQGCKDLDGKGYHGAANWSYGDSYARMALERKFGKKLVELCREHIVSKL